MKRLLRILKIKVRKKTSVALWVLVLPFVAFSLWWLITGFFSHAHAQQHIPSASVTQNASPLCISSDDLNALIEVIHYAEENFLFDVKGNTVGEHMWRRALEELNHSSTNPLSRQDLEETVRLLRTEGEIANAFEPFRAQQTFQRNSNARDFFRLLSVFCEQHLVPRILHPINKSIWHAVASLNDTYSAYYPPAQSTAAIHSPTPFVNTHPPLPTIVPAPPALEWVSAELVADCVVLLNVTTFRASNFTEAIHNELEAVDHKCDSPRLILDVRDNQGGFLSGAVEVADVFLSEGTIASTYNPRTGQGEHYEATAKRLDFSAIAVLVNHNTASGAEVLTAALTQNGIGVAVGRKTHGKGVVQTRVYLQNGGRLLLTTSYIAGPSGDTWHNTGITPSVRVPSVQTERILGLLDAEDEQVLERFNGDNYLRRALEHLQE